MARDNYVAIVWILRQLKGTGVFFFDVLSFALQYTVLFPFLLVCMHVVNMRLCMHVSVGLYVSACMNVHTCENLRPMLDVFLAGSTLFIQMGILSQI